MSGTETPTTALAGLKVVDLGRIVAAPLCGMLLGDLGAEVVKVEPRPDGDYLRAQHPEFAPGMGSYFATANRNKRSLVLDLRGAGGRRVLSALLADADVLLENFRPGVLEAIGLSDDAVARQYPRLIVARVSAYGHTGPKSHLPGVDQIIQGVSGLMSVSGDEASGPMRCGIAVCDVLAALAATIGVLAALEERRRSGRGQVVRTSLLEATLGLLTVQAGRYLATGTAPAPEGNHHPVIAPYGLFPTSDGFVQLQIMHDRHFVVLAELCGHPEWPADPRFASGGERSRHRRAVIAAVAAATPGRSTAEWLALLQAADIPCGPVLDVRQAFEDAQATALGMVLTTALGDGTPVSLPGFPLKLSRTPPDLRRPPPRLGEHSRELLQELGLADDPEALAAAGLAPRG